MKNTLLVTTLLLVGAFSLSAQPTCYLEHYSTEDGLPQFTIMDMLQDHKGFMWFATWDGFSKFDGHTFRNYKVQAGDDYYMRSNRIERIAEDRYGNIWMESYDKEAHCFSPRTETFNSIYSTPGLEKDNFRLSRVLVQPSGSVWLLSEINGCIHIVDSLFTIKEFSKEKGLLKGNHIHDIFEDSSGNSWIMTDNGLVRTNHDHSEIVPLFFENTKGVIPQAFFAAIEQNGEIWFGSNNGRIWRYNKSTLKFSFHELQTQSSINGFRKIDDHRFIITTTDHGFFVCDQAAGITSHYHRGNTPAMKSNHISGLFLDSDQRFWFQTDELGIYKFDTHKQEVKFFFVETDDYSMTSSPSHAKVIEDKNGHIWVHPRGGGFSFYDKEKDAMLPFYNKKTEANWKFSNILHCMYSDKQGNLWLSTRSHGLEKVTFEDNYFTAKRVNRTSNSIYSNDTRAVMQDADKQIWIATKDRRLALFDESGNYLGSLSPDGSLQQEVLFTGQVYSLMQDDQGTIWVGTKSDGLFRVTKTDNPRQYNLKQFKRNEADIYSISDDIIYSIYQDSKKNIWVATYGNGLNLMQETPEGKIRFINHRNILKNYPIETGYRIRFVTENRYGNICVGTTAGLIMFSSSFSSPDEIEYRQYSRMPGDVESLGANDIHGICSTQSGDLFLVTFGGGLNKVAEFDEQGFPTRFKVYGNQDGLPSAICLAIVEDENNNLWVSMENNLTKFDPNKESFETFVEVRRLMSTHNFSEASATRLNNGDILFGYSNGVLTFSPEQIKKNGFVPYIALSDFKVFNRPVVIGGEDSPLQESIDDVSKVVLKRDQNFFSVEFSALDFVLSNDILYAYKLEGFDNDWIYSPTQRVANYTNIPPGEYLLRVKSTNSEGVWEENERVLPIEVLPSFWETTLAYFLYALLFCGVLFAIFKVIFIFYRLKDDVKIETQVSEMKLRFFTDISHEIRTPLTMITAPVDYMLNEEDTPDKIKQQLKLISQNTNRLLRLVNQILDFRKMQHLQLKVQETNLGNFVENVAQGFKEAIVKHNIRFEIVNEAKDEMVWADREALERIVTNLLSNAFKYTPDGNHIQVTVRANEKNIFLDVKDEGLGIPKEKQKLMFTRFAAHNDDKSKPSTGIGLHIVYDLVNKHNGKIVLESEVGKGSLFTVIFQRGFEHFSEEIEVISSDTVLPAQTPSSEDKLEDEAFEEQRLAKKPAILVVEDDPDLRAFIHTILENKYTVYEAEDGVEGLKMAEELLPDFIVSDIMMPNMDGIELMKRLKRSINTSHIPVVLLTAKSTIESKLEGLEYGADDYITKPFSVPYFRARVNNLLEQRNRLQEIYRNQLNSTQNIEYEPQPFVVTSQDELLMKKVVKEIEDHIDDGDFSVKDLSQLAGMSRSVFFNKVKSLTGLAPLEFMREVKMKRAAQLLSSGEYMVKEVSYMVGISDTKYFGKCFKARYGVSPQEYKTQHHGSSDNSGS